MIENTKYIQYLWQEKVPTTEPINIYINIPFCFCHCRYCLYKGKLQCSEEEKKKFIYEYLIQNLNQWLSILERYEVESVYFGGGTPNTVSIKCLEDICLTLGDIYQRAHCRIFEFHPAFLKDDYLQEACQKLNPTLITFGAQSFDKEALKKQRRTYCSQKRIKELGQMCHSYDVKFSLDIMAYLKDYNGKDLKIFEKDIEATQATDADFITIYPELNLILEDNKARQDYIQTAIDVAQKAQDYFPDSFSTDNLETQLQENRRSIFRLINKKHTLKAFKNNILPYYEDDFPLATMNILGFGDCGTGQETVSYSPKRIFFVERNMNERCRYDLKYMS